MCGQGFSQEPGPHVALSNGKESSNGTALGYLGHPSKVVTFGAPCGQTHQQAPRQRTTERFRRYCFTACIQLCNFTTAAPRHFTELSFAGFGMLGKVITGDEDRDYGEELKEIKTASGQFDSELSRWMQARRSEAAQLGGHTDITAEGRLQPSWIATCQAVGLDPATATKWR